MASKSKRRSRGRTAVDPIDQVRRSLDRGDYRKALKDARVGYRREPTPELRCYLEHAYAGRVQQLVQHRLIEDSRRVVRELLDLGITEPSVEAGLPELLLSVGMLDALPQGYDGLTEQQRDRLRVKAADQAVLHPEHTPASMPELMDGAQRVRAALQAVERKDEPAAQEHLKGIPRQSPFADWKYFVRGLTAYYQHDTEGMLANWDRLDQDRAATKIAATLKAVAGVGAPRHDGSLSSKISRLEKQATDQTVLSQLARLRQRAAEDDWPQVFKTLIAVRDTLRSMDEDVYRRLVSCLCGMFAHDGLVVELEKLAKIVDPPPIDPYWNRAKAVACENSDFHDSDDTLPYWQKYLVDLKDVAAFSPPQRDWARGLVWLRLAGYYMNDAMAFRRCRCGADHEPDIEDAEEEARNAFDQCLNLMPAHVPAYVRMAGLYLEADRPGEAASVFRRLLDHVPDNLDALRFLGNHYVAHGDPLKAREYAERARQLKPLDNATRDLLWSTHIGAARQRARTGQYDQARDEMTAADQLQPARKDDYDVLARKAALEIKAGCAQAARRLVEQAQEQLGEPTALWLVMTIEAIRYELPKSETWLYEKRWRDALKRRCRSETAGLMCRMLDAHLKMPQPYLHHQEHRRYLLQYVRRCSRVKWQPEDLRSVCGFLEEVEEPALLAKFAKRGTRKCPEAPYFHWLVARAEMQKGPFRFNRQLTLDRLRAALELATKSNDPRDKQIVEDAKRYLNLVESDSPEFEDDDDFDDGSGDTDDDRYGGHRGDGFPVDMEDLVREVCGRFGLDAAEILDELVGAGPGEPRRTRTKRRGAKKGRRRDK